LVLKHLVLRQVLGLFQAVDPETLLDNLSNTSKPLKIAPYSQLSTGKRILRIVPQSPFLDPLGAL
jgi:hypothetical protein